MKPGDVAWGAALGAVAVTVLYERRARAEQERRILQAFDEKLGDIARLSKAGDQFGERLDELERAVVGFRGIQRR